MAGPQRRGRCRREAAGWLGNVDPNDVHYSQHVCDGQSNTQNHCNQQVDDLLNEARTETDMERRCCRVLVVMLGVSIIGFAVPRPRSSWSAYRRR